MPAEPMLPVRYRVTGRTVETRDSATLRLEPVDRPLAPFRPGQFAMLYAYGVGEVPISISGIGDDGTLVHTVRSVGAVSKALQLLRSLLLAHLPAAVPSGGVATDATQRTKDVGAADAA